MFKKNFCSKKIIITLAVVLLIVSAFAETGLAKINELGGIPNPLKEFVGKSFTYDLSKHFSDSTGDALGYNALVFLDPNPKDMMTDWMKTVTLSSAGMLTGGAPTAADADIQDYLLRFMVTDRTGASIGFSVYIQVVGEANIAVTPLFVIDSSLVYAGESSRKTFTVSNTGVKDLAISTVTLSGDNASEFTIQNDGCSNKTLSPGQSATLDAVFTPTSAGSKVARITIASNDPDTPQLITSLNMNAAVREPNIAVTPMSDSSSVYIGESLTKTFTISNTGSQNLTVGAIAISSETLAEFSIQTFSNRTLTPGQSATLTVVFTPTTAGSKTATITIPSNDPDTPSLTVSLNMTAVVKPTDPIITPDPIVTPPSAPVLYVTTQGKKVIISWSPSANAAGYTFYYGTAPDTASMVSVDAGMQTGFSLELWEGAAFYLAVRAYNSAGAGNFSNIEFFRILITPVLTVTTSGSTVTASWTAVPGATGYTLYYAPYPNAEVIKSTDMGNQTGFSVALPNTALYIAIQAYNSKTTSGYSNIGYFVTK